MVESSHSEKPERLYWRPSSSGDIGGFKAAVLNMISDYRDRHPDNADRSLDVNRDRLLDLTIYSSPRDWEPLPSDNWLEARHIDRPDLTLMVRTRSQRAWLFVEVGNVVLEHLRGELLPSGSVRPFPDEGEGVTPWAERLWQLAHEVKGVSGSS